METLDDRDVFGLARSRRNPLTRGECCDAVKASATANQIVVVRRDGRGEETSIMGRARYEGIDRAERFDFY